MAAVLDVRHRKISNRLIVCGVILCLLFALGSFNIQTFILVLRDLSLPVISLYLLYLARVIGAGDIKLFSIISGFMGFQFTIQACILSFFAGAIWSIVLLHREGALFNNMQLAVLYLADLFHGEIHAYDIDNSSRIQINIPFSVCILVGVLCAFLMESFGALYIF